MTTGAQNTFYLTSGYRELKNKILNRPERETVESNNAQKAP